jgi:serine protease inhibitor
MKRRKLEEALDHIDPKHIAEAAAPVKKKKKALPWIGAVAAILALVLAGQFIEIPMAIRAEAISLAKPNAAPRPDSDDYQNLDQWRADLDAWTAQRDNRSVTAKEALAGMGDFLKKSTSAFLSGEGNQLYSPINAAIGLATVTELTAGDTRQQLLDTLGAADTETLARYVSALWESVYKDNGKEICTLATSLWLDEGVKFNQNVMDTLAESYYVSVYRQDLQSKKAINAIQAWLNNNTGDFLRDSVNSVQLPQEALLALYSTIYFQAKWGDEFNASRNTQDVFHSPSGDVTVTYMNKKLAQMMYYWGDSFGAVSLSLKNGSRMWFILPDGDKTVEDVLTEGQYLDMALSNWDQSQYVMVNLSVPKFDVQAKKDLKAGLMELGITDLFQYGAADFSASLEEPAFISSANQAVRVKIDETGVTAAAYIELPGAGAAAPPDEIIDFILDRPFLFLITDSTGIPLFAGSVQNP